MGGPYRIRIVNRGFGVALSLLTVSAVAQITPISFGSPAVATKITAQTISRTLPHGVLVPRVSWQTQVAPLNTYDSGEGKVSRKWFTKEADKPRPCLVLCPLLSK